ncbi:MAG: hypothetical protein IJQ58_11220, partial [Synergistaceae bacterium]|nr:hypothetical protein [Synergistaceae bacterium]
SWGDSGYFWMSYEQKITSVTAYVADVVPDGTTVYYHDALGHVGDFGYTSNSANIPGWAANVFKAEGENQLLSEVSFFTTENNAPYEIYVFKLGAEKPSTFSVNAENSATKKTGEATYAGYHVVALDDKIAIDDGEYFAVVVNTKNTGSYNIAVERASNYSSSAGGGYYANPVINAGESYFAGSDSFPSSWEDGSTMSPARNACIKAFTVHLVQINATLFPDEAFRTYVATFDTDNDGYLSDSEIAAVTSITFTDTQASITDLTGIKYFTALTALDVSKLTSLASLDVSDLPKLASLILGTNNVIELLKVTGTALTTLDVSNCTKLNLSNITRDSTLTLPGLTPEFKAASLLLSGQIGVNFYVYFPNSVTPTGSSTAFSIRGKTPHAPQPYDATFTKDVDGTTCYGFTCRINSAQMADPITATLTFGDNQTLTMDYSAKDYLALGLASGGDEVTQNLYKAIWNYGHYVQPMLATANNWTIGDKYLAMPALDGATLDVDAVKSAMTDYASVITSSDSNFATMSISLMLESETTINIYLNPKSTISDTVYATFDDGDKYAVSKIQEGTHAGEYLIESDSIPAHKLGESQKLKIEAGNSWIQIDKLSAMSYVRTSLNSDSTSDDDKNACAALYDYFKATEAYRTQHDNTGQYPTLRQG